MGTAALSIGSRVIFERVHFPLLLQSLSDQGYRVIGPSIREQAIVYDTLHTVDDLPIGYTDEQEGGFYRLKKRQDAALFGYTVGPHSWKKFLHPPTVRLWSAQRTENGFELLPENQDPPRLAFLGVRSCDLHAIAVQDTVFLRAGTRDPAYQLRRGRVCILAVNCGQAGNTCFCTSMNTGPQATSGFDLALTEILDEQQHFFVIEVGTTTGADILRDLPTRPAGEDELERARDVVAAAAGQMGRALDTTDIKNLLYRNSEHPRWDEVATRCLTCGNCTMVCPTCFCTTIEDTTDLSGEHAERWRRWDSCFTLSFSSIVGGSVRASSKSRYRQWMTHKLASWYDQFGTSGCVGCGRCITWCPVGIDITEETRAIRATDGASGKKEM